MRPIRNEYGIISAIMTSGSWFWEFNLETSSHCKHVVRILRCCLVCLGSLFFVSSSFGQPGSGIGIVERISQNSITISFPSQRERSFDQSQFVNITAQKPTNLTTFEIGDPVMVRGDKQGDDRIHAFMLIKRLAFQKKPMGNSAMIFGKVVSKSPLIIETDYQNRIQVDLSSATSILFESPALFSQIEVGSSVMARNRSLIILASSLNSAGGDRHLMANQSSKPPCRVTKSVGKLPSPPEQFISHFDAGLVNSKVDSPFGFFDPNQLRFTPLLWNNHFPDTMRDLGVHWALSGATFSFTWKRIQGKEKSGKLTKYDWHRMDRLVGYYFANNITPIGMIVATEPVPGGMKKNRRTPCLPDDLTGYRNFVQAVVERYDHDGFNDMPGLPMAIKNWVIENEPISPKYFNGSGADYAVILKNAWQAIKIADPSAIVITSMVRATGWQDKEKNPRAFMISFFSKLAAMGGERPYDFIDQHWIGFDTKKSLGNQYRIYRSWLTDLNETAAKYGFSKAPFMALEVAGRTSGELEHAEDIVKRYVYMLSLGVRKIFWSGIRAAPTNQLDEKPQENYFSQVVLIRGNGVKKPGYYTYRFMVEMLDGADWTRTKTIAEDDGLILVQFQKNDKPLWVAWNDDSGKKKYSLALPAGVNKVMITKGVPDVASGEKAMEDGSAFGIKVLNALSGRVEIPLDSGPVYITPL